MAAPFTRAHLARILNRLNPYTAPTWTVAPVITSPLYAGNTATLASAGTVTGYPQPSVSTTWLVNGTDVGAGPVTVQAGDSVVARRTAGNAKGVAVSDSAAVVVQATATVLTLGMLGGQMSFTDYAREVPFLDLMDRGRTYTANQFGNAGFGIIRVASLTRAGNVVSVVLSSAPGPNPGDFTIETGHALTLTCIPDPTFDADGALITVTDQTHFSYPNAGPNATAVIVTQYDVAGCVLGRCSVNASGWPNVDHRVIFSAGNENPDILGTYQGTFMGAAPANLSALGGTISNYTPGGSTFTFQVVQADTETCTIFFSGVPSNYGGCRLILVGEDQSGNTVLRPQIKTHSQRYAYGAMRWMDAFFTNGNPSQKSWATRGKRATGAVVPLEKIIAAQNEIGGDLWLNIPTMAADDYVTGMVTTAIAQLAAGKSVILEYSNEPWNPGNGFDQYTWIHALSKAAVKGIYHNQLGYNEIASISRTSNVVTVTLTHALPAWFVTTVTADLVMTDTSFSASGVTMTKTSSNAFTYPLAGANGSASSLNGAIFCDLSSNLLSGGERDPGNIRERWLARRIYECGQLAKAANGGTLGPRVKVVYMDQLANFGIFGRLTANTLPWLESQYGPVNAWLSAIGGAPYPRGSGGNVAAILAAMESQNDGLEANYHALRYAATKYGLQVWLYEGGPDLIGVNGTLTAQVFAAAGFRTTTAKVIRKAFEWGVDRFMTFTSGLSWAGDAGASTWGVGFSMSEVLPVGSASSYKQAGIDDVGLAAPPAVLETSKLPGTVRFINGTSDDFDGRNGGLQLNGMQCLNSAASWVEKLLYVPPGSGGLKQLTFWGKFYQGFGANNNALRVYVDGVSVGTIALFSDGTDANAGTQGGYASPTTLGVTLSEGMHIIKCQAPAGSQPDRIGVGKITAP